MDRNGLKHRRRWLILSRMTSYRPRVSAFHCSCSLADVVTVMWKHMFSHVKALVCDAVCIQSAPGHLADTLAAFTLSALDR